MGISKKVLHLFSHIFLSDRSRLLVQNLKPRRELLEFWNEGADGVGKIIWGLKFRGPKCTICSLKFGAGEII